MNIAGNDFRVPEGVKVNLEKWPTLVEPVCTSKKEYRKILEKQVEEVSELQRMHYASNRHALLLIFHGMDSAGKDGGTPRRQLVPSHGASTSPLMDAVLYKTYKYRIHTSRWSPASTLRPTL